MRAIKTLTRARVGGEPEEDEAGLRRTTTETDKSDSEIPFYWVSRSISLFSLLPT